LPGTEHEFLCLSASLFLFVTFHGCVFVDAWRVFVFLFQRLLEMLEGLNFKEFVALLSAFSARATQDDKLKCKPLIHQMKENQT
jgi:hypothetical protein